MEYIELEAIRGSDQMSEKNVKLVLLGEYAVGKSCLATRFVSRNFNLEEEATIGCAFFTQKVVMNNKLVVYQIWDTAGQEKYRCLTRLYYRGSQAAVVVYDICDYVTFKRAQEWVKILDREVGPNVVIALAGNKADLRDHREVQTAEAQEYADQRNLIFMETSAMTSMNVNEIFVEITRKLLEDRISGQPGGAVGTRSVVLQSKEGKRCPRC